MSAFTLRRYGDQDMLLDFCNDKGIAIGYWTEKLDMNEHTKNAAIMAIDTNAFFEDVKESLTQWFIEEGVTPNHDNLDPVMNGLREDVSFDDAKHPFNQLLDLSIDHPVQISPNSNPAYDCILPDPNPEDACNIFDPENVPGEHYTLEWVRTCMALQWAARTVLQEAEANTSISNHRKTYVPGRSHITGETSSGRHLTHNTDRKEGLIWDFRS